VEGAGDLPPPLASLVAVHTKIEATSFDVSRVLLEFLRLAKNDQCIGVFQAQSVQLVGHLPHFRGTALLSCVEKVVRGKKATQRTRSTTHPSHECF
jgi:hypothetical protein